MGKIKELIDDSPLLKMMATPKLKKMLSEEKLHGIYLYIDADGNTQVDEYKTDPKFEISTLKKALLK